MSYITTFSGLKFDPLNADITNVKIDDIAHALSLLCRANGHYPHFYSVAQHSINCMKEAKARGFSDRVQLGCLLHDASEAYLSDITRPVKSYLTGYLNIEKQLQDRIFNKWVSGLTNDERSQIFEIDDAILYHEFLFLMNERISESEPELLSKPSFSFEEFEKVENRYKRIFFDLTGECIQPFVGVDWLKGKWIVAELCGNIADYKIYNTISEICDYYSGISYILIDAPIGLPESSEEVQKRPDASARKYLKMPARKSSVFPVPFRQLIYTDDKQKMWEISRMLGAKTSYMSTGIFGCIRQVDEFVCQNTEWREKLVESHPECAFQALNHNKGLLYSKHTDAGIAERISILKEYVCNVDSLLLGVKDNQREDLLDALCLAVTASKPFESVQEEIYYDSKGLPMRIVVAMAEEI